jgi:hypothetical protein
LGSFPPETGPEDVDRLLRRLPVPEENAEPVQNCVSWVADAIRELQQHDYAETFNVADFMDHALQLGDEKLAQDPDLLAEPFKKNYTSRRFP